MTGTGTQADPYIIQNFADLLNVSGGSNKYYKLGVDIDANNTSYANGWKTVTLNCSNFDGDGHTIRNIVMESQDSTVVPFYNSYGESKFQNLNIENVYLLGRNPSLFSFANNYRKFTNCKFSLRIFSTSTNSDNDSFLIAGQQSDFYSSSVLLEVDEKNTFHRILNGSVYDSQFKLIIRTNASSMKSTSNKLFDSNFNGSYLLGSITCSNNTLKPAFFNSMSNSYMAANVSGFGTITPATTILLPSFYDNDLVDSASVISSVSNLHPLTTAQCKDAAYLKSIGFAVEGSD